MAKFQERKEEMLGVTYSEPLTSRKIKIKMTKSRFYYRKIISQILKHALKNYFILTSILVSFAITLMHSKREKSGEEFPPPDSPWT